jgi:hypothetical protein
MESPSSTEWDSDWNEDPPETKQGPVNPTANATASLDSQTYALPRGVDTWRARERDLRAFLTANDGRPPRQNADDVQERHLGRWVSLQKLNAKERTKALSNPLLYIEWTHLIRDFPLLAPPDIKWYQTAEEVARFVDQHQHAPRFKGKFPDESQLGRWVGYQRHNAKYGGIFSLDNHVLLAAWTQLVDRYPCLGTPEDIWRQTARQLDHFLHTHPQQLPQLRSEDPHEHRLAKWIAAQKQDTQRARRAQLNPNFEREWTRLGETYPQLLASKEHAWWDMAHQVYQFLHTHAGSAPRTRGGDAHETQLGEWVAAQKKQAPLKESGMGLPSRQDEWERMVQTYPSLGSTEVRWRHTLHELETYLETHEGRMPRQQRHGKTETRLGQWVNNQKTSLYKHPPGPLTPLLREEWERVVARFPSLAGPYLDSTPGRKRPRDDEDPLHALPCPKSPRPAEPLPSLIPL